MKETIDVWELMTEEASAAVEHKAVDEMLVDSLNRFGGVDIRYIAAGAGLTVEQAVWALRGVIFQSPEYFDGGVEYSLEDGWLLSAVYLSGNIEKKLKTAKRMNEECAGAFSDNVKALKCILPPHVPLNDVRISMGASWIPAYEYVPFLCKLLNLQQAPEVIYNRDLARFKVVASDQASLSVLNTITYGVREEHADLYASGWTKQYLTALQIVEDTLNAKTVKVFDYIPRRSKGWNTFDYEPVFNKEKTVEAQDKQKMIVDAFNDWVYEDKERAARFEGHYNDRFVGYTFTQYDGSFLTLPDLNPDIVLYKHQRDAIARVLLSGNHTLFAHDVGTGKTYEMIVSVHELKRMGLSNRNLIVVPNNVLQATVDAHRLLYPKDRILVVYPQKFTPARRNEILEDIRTGDYTAIYMAYSSFDLVVMSKQHYVDKASREIRHLKEQAFNAKSKYEEKELIKQAKALSKKLQAYIEKEKECPWLTFDRLNIDTLVVDEAHNYKNIPIASRTDNVVGMSSAGSKKCREMLEKTRVVKRVLFATGTPLTNSLADLFTFQTYLQPRVLTYHDIHTFDAWVNTFGQRETSIECDVDANSNSLRTVTRFSSFHNLGELMALFAQVCDFHYMETTEDLPAYDGPINVSVPKSEAQARYIQGLSERTEKIRAREVSRTEDNLLKVTTDGRKAALDIRLADDRVVVADEKNKIQACAQTVMELYRAHPQTTQVVFSDIGTPKASFNVYDALKNELCRLGMREDEIAFVHDATTDAARSSLFAAMNKGKIRVVIGSTQKLGVGVNVQERLIALHHLSVPWRPADMVQREGRILRKGNTCPKVYIYRYITEGSFDAYSWQLLENKQRFISSFLNGTSGTRDMADIDDAVLSYAEVKALAIGNPLIKKRVEISNTLERTKIASRARQLQLQELRSVIETTPEKSAHLQKLSQIARDDFAAYTSQKRSIPNEERIAFGEELLAALADNVGEATERMFDEYQGFFVVLPAKMRADDPFVLVCSERGRYTCKAADKTPMGCSRTIDSLLDRLGERADELDQKVAYLQQQVVEATADLELGNPYLKEVEAYSRELADLDMELEAASKKEEDET